MNQDGWVDIIVEMVSTTLTNSFLTMGVERFMKFHRVLFLRVDIAPRRSQLLTFREMANLMFWLEMILANRTNFKLLFNNISETGTFQEYDGITIAESISFLVRE